MLRFALSRAAIRRTLGIWTVALVAACTSGIPAPTPGPTAAGSNPASAAPASPALATPRPTATERAKAPAFTTWGDWIADVPALPEISMSAGLLQLSISWEDGKSVWLQTSPDFRQVLQSTSLAAAADELRLRSDAANTNCSLGSEGRYRWSRSADGLFLTLTLIEEECPTRAALFARTWVHSHGAVNDGGLGVNYGVEPMIQMTLPRSEGQRWGMSGGMEASPELKTFGADPFRAFVVVQNPGGFEGQGAFQGVCKPERIAIDHTIEAFVRYVERMPILKVDTSMTEVGGRTAARLDVQAPGSTCQPDGFPAFRPERMDDDYSWWFAPSERQPLYIVQMDASTTYLLWYQGPAGEEEQVIKSISFIEELPTP